MSSELAGVASLDDPGATVELVGAASELSGAACELLDSIREDMASATELLTGSWLRGMSTILLELLGAFSTWLELAAPSVWLTLLVVSGEFAESGRTESSDELLSSTGRPTWPEVGEEESSQAFSVKAAAMPSVAAMALLAAAESCLFPVIFFFSIFFFPPNN